MIAHQIHDPLLSQHTYLVAANGSSEAIIIDPECDIDRYQHAAERRDLTIAAAFETHLHADFLSGLRAFAEAGVPVYASDAGAPDVRYDWLLETTDVEYRLLTDGDIVSVDGITIEALHTPGHAPEHLCYLLSSTKNPELPDAVATGDFLLVGGAGAPAGRETGNGTSASGTPTPAPPIAHDALQRIAQLPPSTHVWPLHSAGTLCGYAPSAWPVSTVGHETETNPFLRAVSDDTANVHEAAEGSEGHALSVYHPSPPGYFTRVRRRNRTAPPSDCTPASAPWISPEHLQDVVLDADALVLDTRPSVHDFLGSHLRGALYVPFNDDVLTLAGAFVPTAPPIYLVAAPDLETDPTPALRALARIGIDRVAGLFPSRLHDSLPEDLRTPTSLLSAAHLPLLARHPGVAVVDIRMPGAYTRDHVHGAVNMPYTQLPETASALPMESVIVVHGGSVHETTAAGAYLVHCGYDVGCAFETTSVPVQA